MISININKYSNVNCTLNRVFLIHDFSRICPMYFIGFSTYAYLILLNDLFTRSRPTKSLLLRLITGISSKRRVFYILCSECNLDYCICLYKQIECFACGRGVVKHRLSTYYFLVEVCWYFCKYVNRIHQIIRINSFIWFFFCHIFSYIEEREKIFIRNSS